MDNRTTRRRDKDGEILCSLLHFLVNGAHQSIDSGVNHRSEESNYNWFHCTLIVADMRELRKGELL